MRLSSSDRKSGKIFNFVAVDGIALFYSLTQYSALPLTLIRSKDSKSVPSFQNKRMQIFKFHQKRLRCTLCSYIHCTVTIDKVLTNVKRTKK